MLRNKYCIEFELREEFDHITSALERFELWAPEHDYYYEQQDILRDVRELLRHLYSMEIIWQEKRNLPE